MGATLTEQRRVSDEGPMGCKALLLRKNTLKEEMPLVLTVLFKKVTAYYVPAAAVIRRWQALSGIIGRKGCAGG